MSLSIEAARALARTALPEFGIDDSAEISFVKYRENHVFRVAPENAPAAAVRLHRPDYRTDAEILTELRYIRALGDRGFAVPEIVPALDGSLFRTVSAGGDSRRVSVQRWIEGAVPAGDVVDVFRGTHEADAGQFAAIGELLARLHGTAEQLGRPAGFERSPWDADGLAGPAPLWGDPTALRSLTDAERAAIQEAVAVLRGLLGALPLDAHHYGVVHADLTPENILVRDDELIVIDFDDFGEGWYLFDLATVLFFYTPRPGYRILADALWSAYDRIRPLSTAERATADAMILARGLSYLGWASERPGDEASDFIESDVAPWVARAARALVRGEAPPWTRADAASPPPPA